MLAVLDMSPEELRRRLLSDVFDDPWDRTSVPMTSERLVALEDSLAPGKALATSAGHRRTLRVARELLDEVVRLRGNRCDACNGSGKARQGHRCAPCVECSGSGMARV